MEQGYNLAKESGRDLEEGIACATAGLRRRFAARVWRDYYKHVDARRRYANPTDEGLIAQQRDRQIEEDSRRRENEERVAQYSCFAATASNRSACFFLGGGGLPYNPWGSRPRSRPRSRPWSHVPGPTRYGFAIWHCYVALPYGIAIWHC